MKPPAAAGLLVVALACAAWAEAQDTEWNRYTLEDFGGVFIGFERPELRISLGCVNGPSGSAGTMAYTVGPRIQQAAQMLRDTQITLPEAVTWYTTKFGVTSDRAAAEAVGATLMELIDGFATAWRAIHEEPGSIQGAA